MGIKCKGDVVVICDLICRYGLTFQKTFILLWFNLRLEISAACFSNPLSDSTGAGCIKGVYSLNGG